MADRISNITSLYVCPRGVPLRRRPTCGINPIGSGRRLSRIVGGRRTVSSLKIETVTNPVGPLSV